MKETKVPSLHDCYQEIYLHSSEYKMKEIAQFIGHSRKNNWCLCRCLSEWWDRSIDPRHSQRRPRRLSKLQETEFKESILTKLPSKVGFGGYSNWTLSFVVLLVEEIWGINYSLKGISLIVKWLGLSHTRPSYILANADSARKPSQQ